MTGSGIRPGTDGLLILSLVHELLKARRIDVDYLMRYSNAAWLVVDQPGTAEHGLFARDKDPASRLVFETVTRKRVVQFGTKGGRAAFVRARPAWKMADLPFPSSS